MDESGIEATQALFFDDEADDDVADDNDKPVAFLNVPCQKGFAGKEYPLFEGDNVIGRDIGCKVCIPLKALSREHACIEIHGSSHFIYDKASRNKTSRNKHFLVASVRYELQDNDKLVFGDVQCTFQLKQQEVDDDDGSETGSESMFQTAPDDEELADTTDNKTAALVDKPLDDMDGFESDASSDILQPTQPFAGHTQSMLSKTVSGNTTVGQNVTVKETPAAKKRKRLTDEIVLPESDSETEDSSKPPETLILADSQDEEDVAKSRLIGAATQAFVCDSDLTTDEEEEEERKKSLLMAPTQAFVDDSTSTCSEDSPEKKSILMAATQAFVTDIGDEKSPVKKQILTAETQAYDMGTGIDPTMTYDMLENKDKEPGGNRKSESLMFEPTQGYPSKDTAAEKKEDDDASDTSEEFVLEGDTDNEDNPSDSLITAQTVPCDMETQAVTDVTECGDATVAVEDDTTQVVEDNKTAKCDKNVDETVPVTEMETQAVSEVDKRNAGARCDDVTQVLDDVSHGDTVKPKVTSDDATLVIGDGDVQTEGESKEKDESETLCLEEPTQVLEDHSRNRERGKVREENIVETQVMEGDSTQVLDNGTDGKSCRDLATQVIDETDHQRSCKKLTEKDSTVRKGQNVKELNPDAVTEAFSDDETFDITSAATLAPASEVISVRHSLKGTEMETQALDDADATMAVPVEDETYVGKAGKNKQLGNHDDGTQIIEEATVPLDVTNASRTKGSKAAAIDDATQVIGDATVPVGEEESLVATKKVKKGVGKKPAVDKNTKMEAKETGIEDATVKLNDDDDVEGKHTTVGVADTVPVEDTTQVITDATLAVSELETVAPSKSSAKKTDDVFNDGATMSVEENELASATVKDSCILPKHKNEAKFDDGNATQTFAENRTEDSVKYVAHKKGRTETRKTEVEKKETEETASGEESVENNSRSQKEMSIDAENEQKPKGSRSSKRNREIAKLHDEKESEMNKGSDKTDGIRASKRSSRQKGDSVETENTTTTSIVNKKTENEGSGGTGNEDEGRGSRRSRASRKQEESKGKEETSETVSGTNVVDSGQKVRKSGRVLKRKVDQEVSVQSDEKYKTKRKKADSSGKDAVESTEAEAETQVYTEGSDNEGATQRYGDDDDATPELTPEEQEETPSTAVPTVVVSPSKSPLKSALASPKKSSSPSPKRVKFVSQGSETSSESSQPSRRSSRGKARAEKIAGNSDDKSDETEVLSKENSKAPLIRQSSKRVRHSKGENSLVTEEQKEHQNNDIPEGKIPDSKPVSKLGVRKSKRTRDHREPSSDGLTSDSAGPDIDESVVKPSSRKGRQSMVESETTNINVSEKEDLKSSGGKKTSKKGKMVGKEDLIGDKKMPEGKNEKSDPKSRRSNKKVSETHNESVSNTTEMTVKDETKGGNVRATRNRKKNEVEDAASSSNIENSVKKTLTRNMVKSDDTADTQLDKVSRKNKKEKGLPDILDGDKQTVESQVNTGRRKTRGGKEKENEAKTDGKVDQHDDESRSSERSSRTRKGTDNKTKDVSKQSDKSDELKESSKGSNDAIKSETRKQKVKVKNSEDGKTSSESKESVIEQNTRQGGKWKANDMTDNTERLKNDKADIHEQTTAKRPSRMKRKESDSSSADSQESVSGQPEKRQKTAHVSTPVASRRRSIADTPKQNDRRVSAGGTPRQTGKSVSTDVTSSPALRKSTVVGHRAKVMFTGVVDEQGEKIVKELGGELVTMVTECTHLITDQVRRTVKFLCCLSRGVPIVSSQWLVSSKNSGFFTDPAPFLIQDHVTEKKYKFSLQLSLDKASERPLFTGYKIHVTKSVKPEPRHMKDILTCAGAQYLASMPKTESENVVVVSTEDDKLLCEAAVRSDIPVVNPEFVLTGLLRQEIDLNSYRLFIDGNGNKRAVPSTATDAGSKKRKK